MCVVRLCWIELGMNRREFWSNEDIARKMKDNSLRQNISNNDEIVSSRSMK